MVMRKRVPLRFLASLSMLTALSLGGSAVAFAQSSACPTGSTCTGTVGVNPVVTGGNLYTAASFGAFNSSVSLDGADHTIHGAVNFKVQDLSGSGKGWTLGTNSSITASGHPLGSSDASITLSSNNDLSCASTTADTGGAYDTAHCSAQGVATDGVNIGTPTTVTPLDITTSAQETANAGAAAGMGVYNFTENLAVTIYPNAYAGSYVGTLTLTLVPNP
jgi:hypothetical protein